MIQPVVRKNEKENESHGEEGCFFQSRSCFF